MDLAAKDAQINKQYQPIIDLIEKLPEKAVTGPNGIDYATNSWALELHLRQVIRHCKNLKRRDVDFKPPFTKSELLKKFQPPYDDDKMDWVKKLQEKYCRLDEESYEKGSKVS